MLLLAFLLLLPVQQETPKTAPPSLSAPSAQVDPKLHADVMTYLQLAGVEKKMRDSYPQSLDDARPIMERQCPKCTAEFYVEYKKRMLARADPKTCMDASAATYEKYLSDKDVLELISLQHGLNDGHPTVPSDELKTKLTNILPTMMPEIIGKCSEIGAKLGGEVGTEISKEHPEYLGEIPKP